MAGSTPLETITALIEARRNHHERTAFDCYATDALVMLRPDEQSVGEAAIKAFIAAVCDLNLSFEKHDILEYAGIALHMRDSGYIAATGTLSLPAAMGGLSASILLSATLSLEKPCDEP